MSDNLVSGVDTSQAESTPIEGHNSAPIDNTNGIEVNKTQSPGWYYDENIAGNGDRPEWLKEKYKTAADQAKAYNDLEKKLGAFKGAPEEYDLTLDGDDFKGVTFDKQNPVLQEFLANAKEQGVSQEYVTNMLKSYAKMQKINAPDPQKEMEKIGVNAKQDLQILAQWGSNVLTKEELPIFKNMIKTAEQFRVLDKLRQISTRAVTQPSNHKNQYESEAKIRQMIHDPRYQTDETFRDEVRAKLATVIGE